MTTDDKQTLGMDDMFAHGNEPLPTSTETPSEPQGETAPATTAAERARDEQGRFASQEAAKPAPVPAQPATPAAVTPDHDPEKQPISKAEFKGYLDEKAKRKAAEDRAAALEARIQQFERQNPPQIPSAADPEAFAQYIQQQKTDLAFDMSETMAREKHGDEPVTQAMDWALQRAQQSPAFAAEYLKQKHPIDWAVKQHKRDALMSQVGDDPDAFVRRRAAELGLISGTPPQTEAQPSQAASPQPAPTPTPQAPAPTRSIANATSAGGLQVVPPQGEFAVLELAHKH